MSDAPLILSASSVKSFLGCSWRYYLESVWRVPAAPNIAMITGTAVHSAVQALHERSGPPLEALEASFRAELGKASTPYSEDPSVALTDARAMYELYVKVVAPTFKPTLVEASFVIDVEGVLFSGQIDAADEDVHDTKTTAALTGFKAAYHTFQLTGYHLGYRFLTGRKPRRLLLDVLTRLGPKYRQIEVQPDFSDFSDTLGVVRDGILAGNFEPTGVSTGACRRCPYYAKGCVYGVID